MIKPLVRLRLMFIVDLSCAYYRVLNMFAQIVIGPPGSGKTTYCDGMSQFLRAVGRNVAIVNLDPANDTLPYKADIDISELIKLEEVMESLVLGPNGGLMYCMEFLEENIDWLLKKLYALKDQYLLIDCPGQVELYTHHSSIRNIIAVLQKADFRLAAVHLVDSHYCNDSGKFIAVLLTSLSTMLQLELPHINVLSKVDLIEKFGKLAFNLEYYTEVMNLSYLLEELDVDPFLSKFKKLNQAMVGLVEDYSLVTFQPLNINDKKSVHQVLIAVDRANGYVFGAQEEGSIQQLLCSAMSDCDHSNYIQKVGEMYVNDNTKM